MIRARFSLKTKEVEVAGSRANMKAIAKSVASSGTVPLVPQGDPAPYEKWIEAIKIEETAGSLAIRVDTWSNILRLTGSPQTLQMLAKTVLVLAGAAEENYHLHVEFYPGHPFLDEQSWSLALVLSPPLA